MKVQALMLVDCVDVAVGDTNFDILRNLDFGKKKNKIYKGTMIPTFAEVLATVQPGKKNICGSKIK